MTDKMREEFEAAYVEGLVSRCGEGFRSTAVHSLTEKRPDGEYLHYPDFIAWWAWRASREALELSQTSPEIQEMLKQFEADEAEEIRRAESFVRETCRASISALQRDFKIGYENACRLMDKLVARGIVSPIDAEGRRTVLPEQVKP
ncbi:DNA translocase FtsK [Pseudomonas paracarnis]|uniref:DNA translocase FtsK n=1 Tax=Pseudomonas paracarnis TaxID=2750625 RepID=UPI00249CE8A7|nr:DNA translocase FtsK [Pseudomonas paracarnis]MDI3184679.1 DNA translocase FtsK [Pseudomonas paracarnis]